MSVVCGSVSVVAMVGSVSGVGLWHLGRVLDFPRDCAKARGETLSVMIDAPSSFLACDDLAWYDALAEMSLASARVSTIATLRSCTCATSARYSGAH